MHPAGNRGSAYLFASNADNYVRIFQLRKARFSFLSFTEMSTFTSAIIRIVLIILDIAVTKFTKAINKFTSAVHHGEDANAIFLSDS